MKGLTRSQPREIVILRSVVGDYAEHGMSFMGNTMFIFVSLVCFLASCNNVSGTYVANYNEGRDNIGADTVKIFSDNTYEKLSYPSDDSIHYSDTGTWEILDGVIWFHDWIDRNGMCSGKNSYTCFGASIVHTYFIGTIRLPINSDMNYYYIKR